MKKMKTSKSCADTLGNESKLKTDPFVISGISGRFPKSRNLNELWHNLYNKIDMVKENPTKWTPRSFGNSQISPRLLNVEQFDASYFILSATEANKMDPQTRQLLEVIFEAIFDAGLDPETLRKRRIGIFIGSSTIFGSDHKTTCQDELNGYACLATTELQENCYKLAFHFDFKGPSLAFDAGGSSSLIAFDRACAIMSEGLCEHAIVGGANIIFDPTLNEDISTTHTNSKLQELNWQMSQDVNHVPHVKAEAVVALYVQKESQALRMHARIKTTTFYKHPYPPSPSAPTFQRSLFDLAYKDSDINPTELTYLECNGTGAELVDMEELVIIQEIFCRNRDVTNPLLIGSVKSNMGNVEGCSGLGGVAKIILSMHYGTIPPNLRCDIPDKKIPSLVTGNLRVVLENTKCNSTGLFGITSFATGDNDDHAHVVLQSPATINQINRQVRGKKIKKLPLLILYSGRTQQGVQKALEMLLKGPRNDQAASLLHNIIRSNNRNHLFRGYILNGIGSDAPNKIEVVSMRSKTVRPTWLLYSGMGSQYLLMGKSLRHFKVARKSFGQFKRILNDQDPNLDLFKILLSLEANLNESILEAFVAIVAIQVALTDLLNSVAIHPDGLIGQSFGEICAGYADGCLSKSQAALLAYWRGRVCVGKLGDGAMMAVALPMGDLVKRCPRKIHVSGHTSKNLVVVSGPKDQVFNFSRTLDNEKILSVPLKVFDGAFHSSYVAHFGPELSRQYEQIVPVARLRSGRWTSSSVLESRWNEMDAKFSGGKYYVNNFLSPVWLKEALEFVPINSIIIEMAAHSSLKGVLRMSLPSSCTYICLMDQLCEDAHHILRSIGSLYNEGLCPDVGKLYDKIEHPLCVAPFLSVLCDWDHSTKWNGRKAFLSITEAQFEIGLRIPEYEFCIGHEVNGHVIMAGTGYVVLAWKTLAKAVGRSYDKLPVTFQDVTFHEAVSVSEYSVTLSVVLTISSGNFKILRGESLIATGQVNVLKDDTTLTAITTPPSPCSNQSKQDHHYSSAQWIRKNNFYTQASLRGVNYSNLFDGVVLAHDSGCCGQVVWKGNWTSFLDTVLQTSITKFPVEIKIILLGFQKIFIHPQTLYQFLGVSERPQLQPSSVKNVPVINEFNPTIVKCPGIRFIGVKAHNLKQTKVDRMKTERWD